jgi:hypothetical protein
MNMMVVATEQNPARLGSTVQAVRLQVNPLVTYGVRSPKFTWAPRAQLYLLAETSQLPPPAFGLIYERALLVSQERRHLFVSPWNEPFLESKF